MSMGTGNDPVKIYNWLIDEGVIHGYIFGHPRIGTGHGNTSPVVSQDGDLVTTKSGTVYRLMNPKEGTGLDATATADHECAKCGKVDGARDTKYWGFRDGEWYCDRCFRRAPRQGS